MVKVSIVIPVYNRKNFLTVCIKSLLAQSFEDFEICLVDDGSTYNPQIEMFARFKMKSSFHKTKRII